MLRFCIWIFISRNTFLEPWESAQKTNLNRIQSLRIQSKILRKIVEASFYLPIQVYLSDCDTRFSLSNRPQGAMNTPGLSFPRYPACFILPQLGLFWKNCLLNKWSMLYKIFLLLMSLMSPSNFSSLIYNRYIGVIISLTYQNSKAPSEVVKTWKFAYL